VVSGIQALEIMLLCVIRLKSIGFTGSGLGTMMATALVQNGARVIIASRKEKQLKEVSFMKLV
jgi:short-subunit dehydrogenase involved in D-alanine esterification of teichoic acids